MPLKPPCPICGLDAGAPMVELRFGEKPNLPGAVTLHGCANCDFAFTWPRDPIGYQNHYAAVANDTAQRHGQYRNLPQTEILAGLIVSQPVRSVLDFGCGGGGLLHVLAERFPQVQFLGFDVNADFPSDLPNLRFSNQFPDAGHDLVILSHVVEHMVDIDQIRNLFDLVGEGGLVHIEVPDPKLYASFPQPHFGYYVDRLHINHFSQRALLKIAPQGFDVVAGGTYLRSEARNWADLHAQLRDRRFFVYGFGDNFHRSLAAEGPLHGLEGNILAVIDRNAATLSRAGPARFRFVEPGQTAEIDGALVVCTVSQFSNLADFFRRTYPNSEIRYL
jgi:SAM-dependent methyltransferase